MFQTYEIPAARHPVAGKEDSKFERKQEQFKSKTDAGQNQRQLFLGEKTIIISNSSKGCYLRGNPDVNGQGGSIPACDPDTATGTQQQPQNQPSCGSFRTKTPKQWMYSQDPRKTNCYQTSWCLPLLTVLCPPILSIPLISSRDGSNRATDGISSAGFPRNWFNCSRQALQASETDNICTALVL